MSFTLYDASIPVFLRGFGQLSAILDKAVAYAEAKKIDPAVLINARLAPDMYPLARQIQTASDAAKFAGARLAGVEAPSFPDNETTFDELQQRIAKTVAFLNGIEPSAIAGQEGREIVLKRATGDVRLTGAAYLQGLALPNFYFHLVTAYDILRHNGVELAKSDYLGKP
ncbi:MAG: hypothetical protein JWO51_2518 [Rhodospirillales bacterium]|nr:hypothetical protein [Rhodospirillales bacterium]